MRSAAFSLQEPPPAPGRPAEQAAPRVTQPTQGAPEPTGASDPSPSGFGAILPLLLFIPLILLLVFSSRSQQKKQAAAIAALKKGDRVVTQSGIVGKLVEIGDRYAKVEVASGIKLEILKTGLLGKDSGEAAPTEKK